MLVTLFWDFQLESRLIKWGFISLNRLSNSLAVHSGEIMFLLMIVEIINYLNVWSKISSKTSCIPSRIIKSLLKFFCKEKGSRLIHSECLSTARIFFFLVNFRFLMSSSVRFTSKIITYSYLNHKFSASNLDPKSSPNHSMKLRTSKVNALPQNKRIIIMIQVVASIADRVALWMNPIYRSLSLSLIRLLRSLFPRYYTYAIRDLHPHEKFIPVHLHLSLCQ